MLIFTSLHKLVCRESIKKIKNSWTSFCLNPWNSLLFVGILVSLEIIRELPITLILRPFNFETFATTAYISASEDLLEAAAVPSLFLILIATFFIIVTSKYILRDNNE